jgi:RNA polymerase sigma-70 factor (ECF subfamily)
MTVQAALAITPSGGTSVAQDWIDAYQCEFVRLQPDLIIYLRQLLRSLEDAEDALQETFLIVRERLHTFDATRNFCSWVRGIARNVVFRKRSTLRRARNQPLDQVEDLDALLAAPPAEAPRDAVAEIAAVRAWLTQLTEVQQRLVMMRYVERLGVDTIAKRLSKSSAAVYMSISRIRSSLKHRVAWHRRVDATPGSQDSPPSQGLGASGATAG